LLWQVRAEALLEIRNHHYYRLWSYRDTEKNAKAGNLGRCYPSLGAFTEDLDLPITYKTSYGTAKLAEAPHFQRYFLLRTAPINITFAKRLYELPVDHPIIEPLLLYMHLGGREEEAMRILKDEDQSLQAAKELLRVRLSELPQLQQRAIASLDYFP
jgi:hypothetical protein